MGVFALTTSGLSAYTWFVTVWDLYRPLSSTIASKTPSFSVASFLNTKILHADDEQTTSRGRRSRVRLENAQREQARSSLKALVVWLIIKGMEPIFDNSLGYILPFYNLSKAIILLVFVCFRVQLFESFLLPLGKPNAPLVDVGSLSIVLLPTLRFFLSLPFSHLAVAIKNYVGPYYEAPQSIAEDTFSSSDASSMDSVTHKRRLPSDRVPPPSSRSASTSSTKGSGEGGVAGGAEARLALRSPIVRRKASTNFIPASAKPSTSAKAIVPENAYATLRSLPPAPQKIPYTIDTSGNGKPDTSPQARSDLHAFAFIPPSTPPSKSTLINGMANHATAPGEAATPMMPGYLNSRETTSALLQQGSKEGNADTSDLVDTQSKQGMGSDVKNEVNGLYGRGRRAATTRKRANDDESESSPRKSKVLPSIGKANAMSQSSTLTDLRPKGAPRMKKSVSTTTRSLSEATQDSQEGSVRPSARSRRKGV